MPWWPVFGLVAGVILVIVVWGLTWSVLHTVNSPLYVARSQVPRRVADIAQVADSIARLSPHDGNQVILYLIAIQQHRPRDDFSPATAALGDTLLWMSPEEWHAVVATIASRHSQRFEEARRQHEAARAIGRAKGWVVYECETTAHHYWRDGWYPPEPAWLWNDWVAINLLSAPLKVKFPLQHSIADPDSVLANVEGFTRIDSLNLASNPVTDLGLAHVQGLKSLRTLNLFNTSVTDTGLRYLKGLTHLEWLNLGNTQVTDAGVADLQKVLPNVEIVSPELRVERPTAPR